MALVEILNALANASPRGPYRDAFSSVRDAMVEDQARRAIYAQSQAANTGKIPETVPGEYGLIPGAIKGIFGGLPGIGDLINKAIPEPAPRPLNMLEQAYGAQGQEYYKSKQDKLNLDRMRLATEDLRTRGLIEEAQNRNALESEHYNKLYELKNKELDLEREKNQILGGKANFDVISKALKGRLDETKKQYDTVIEDLTKQAKGTDDPMQRSQLIRKIHEMITKRNSAVESIFSGFGVPGMAIGVAPADAGITMSQFSPEDVNTAFGDPYARYDMGLGPQPNPPTYLPRPEDLMKME